MRKIKGTVISNKMTKTLVVRVDMLKRHPKYQKFYRASKKFKAHVEEGKESSAYHLGAVVMITETRPISRDKRWRVVEVIKRSTEAEDEEKQEM